MASPNARSKQPVQDLVIAAGPSALQHIQQNGLNPNDVSAIFWRLGRGQMVGHCRARPCGVFALHEPTQRADPG